jgi:hypothetical protein
MGDTAKLASSTPPPSAAASLGLASSASLLRTGDSSKLDPWPPSSHPVQLSPSHSSWPVLREYASTLLVHENTVVSVALLM